MGVMGSQQRIHYALENLKAKGWTQEELDMIYALLASRFRCSNTREIALSIVSEYLAVVRGKQGQFLRRKRVVSHES